MTPLLANHDNPAVIIIHSAFKEEVVEAEVEVEVEVEVAQEAEGVEVVAAEAVEALASSTRRETRNR